MNRRLVGGQVFGHKSWRFAWGGDPSGKHGPRRQLQIFRSQDDGFRPVRLAGACVEIVEFLRVGVIHFFVLRPHQTAQVDASLPRAPHAL